jgi:hypothetical protein
MGQAGDNLTAHMAMEKAFRRCRSFRRFVHAVERVMAAIDNQHSVVTPWREMRRCFRSLADVRVPGGYRA